MNHKRTKSQYYFGQLGKNQKSHKSKKKYSGKEGADIMEISGKVNVIDSTWEDVRSHNQYLSVHLEGADIMEISSE
ncbi:Malate synthase, glyoxysomal [Dirofilaria immitis]